MDQVDAILDAREAVRDLAEVAPPELLLAVEVERAVVGRHERQVALDEALPELLLVPVRPCSRSGGEQTNLAPSNPWPRSSSDRNRYCGQVSANAGSPSSWAMRSALSASLADMWTKYTGALAAWASRITRFVASPSKIE